MNQLERNIAQTMREAELGRRMARRQVILNTAALLDDEERQDPETDRAIGRLREAEAKRAAEVQNALMARWSFWARLRFLFTRKLP